MAQTKSFSKAQAISFGWEVFKNNFRFLVLVILIFLFISFASDLIAVKVIEVSPILGFILYAISYFLMILMGIGLTKISLKLYDSQKPEICDLFVHYNLFVKYFLAALLYALAVFAGTILFIIPGIIIFLKYYFYDYYVIDKGYGPMRALKESGEITKGNKWNLFIFVLLVFFINILGVLALFVGFLVTAPVTMLATVFVYRKLLDKSEKEQVTTVEELEPEENHNLESELKEA